MTDRQGQALEAKLAEKLAWARADGCPVAPQTADLAETAADARRRWMSFERRRPKKVEDNLANRVEDLARGMAARYEDDLQMAGPLISDYRWLAEQLAEVFVAELP